MTTPRGLVLVGLLLVLGAVNLTIAEKERLLTRGTTMLLPLTWDDDRSMIQGDYLRLDYALGDVPVPPGTPRDGRLVVRLDAHQVAGFVRFDDGTPLAPGEHFLRYR
ncbi:MAG TPA: GDYXXLXY domain-containing protein, partial [Vicinamibacterales bacterium]